VDPRPAAFASLPARLGDLLPEHMLAENIYRWVRGRRIIMGMIVKMILRLTVRLILLLGHYSLPRLHVHVVPDEQHQFFKLVNQV
jgi:hypothetical protein